MLKKIILAIGLLSSINVFAEISYKPTYSLPYWGGNPYTPMAISRVDPKKSSPNPLNAQFILGIQDREFYNEDLLKNIILKKASPLYLFNQWFIQSEIPQTACTGTQLVLRSSNGDVRGIKLRPEELNLLNKITDCYIAKKYDRVTKVIYLTNDVLAFDSTIGLFFFNMKTGLFYKDVFKTPEGFQLVLYTTQDGDFLLETVESGGTIRRYRDNYDPRIGIRAIRLDGNRIPGKALQTDLNIIPQKKGGK